MANSSRAVPCKLLPETLLVINWGPESSASPAPSQVALKSVVFVPEKLPEKPEKLTGANSIVVVNAQPGKLFMTPVQTIDNEPSPLSVVAEVPVILPAFPVNVPVAEEPEIVPVSP